MEIKESFLLISSAATVAAQSVMQLLLFLLLDLFHSLSIFFFFSRIFGGLCGVGHTHIFNCLVLNREGGGDFGFVHHEELLFFFSPKSK